MTNEFEIDAFESRSGHELFQVLQERSRAVGRRRDQMRTIDIKTTAKRDPTLIAILALIQELSQ